MSTTPYSGPYPTTISEILIHHISTTPAPTRRAQAKAHVLRRRPTAQQGHSLEVLGHAIEYLVDSQLRLTSYAEAKNATEAAHLLMSLSRQVFAECRPSPPRPTSRWNIFMQRISKLI